MTIRHYLIGYSKDGRPRVELEVPCAQMAKVRQLLSLYPDDPDALDPYELLPWQVRRIAELAGNHAAEDDAEYFLQAFQEDTVPAH